MYADHVFNAIMYIRSRSALASTVGTGNLPGNTLGAKRLKHRNPIYTGTKIKARQYNKPEHLLLWKMTKELLRWDSNPRHTAYKVYALPTELQRLNQGNTRTTSLS